MKVLMLVDVGIWDILLLVRVKKNKGKKSQAHPTEKKREKKNQIIQTMNQQGKKPIIIITMLRVV